MNNGTNPLMWDTQLLSHWSWRNPAVFKDYLANLINNLRGGHCFVSCRTRRNTGGKITPFKLGHTVLTVAYNGSCSPNVSLRIAWILFYALSCREKNLMKARVSMLLKSRASPDMLPFSLCIMKRLAIRRMNRPLFPTTLSIPFYDIA
jgi:hypothetical protein